MLTENGLTFKKVILAVGKSDLRRGIDGLAAMVRLKYGLDPLQEDILFLFCGVRHDAYISCQVLEKESGGDIHTTGCLMHCRRYFAEAFFVQDAVAMNDEELKAVRWAKVNAIMYSIVETAKANNANVPIYLQYLFEQIPLHRAGGDKDYMAEMIPWSEKYRVYLLKGMWKVDGEFALFGAAYNLSRAENMFTFEELMARVGRKAA